MRRRQSGNEDAVRRVDSAYGMLGIVLRVTGRVRTDAYGDPSRSVLLAAAQEIHAAPVTSVQPTAVAGINVGHVDWTRPPQAERAAARELLAALAASGRRATVAQTRAARG